MKDLKYQGIRNVAAVHWNLPASALYEKIVSRQEGLIAHLGPVVVRTGAYTGRSPKDKFIVEEPTSSTQIHWGGENQPFTSEKFDLIHYRMLAYLQGKEIFVQDRHAGADRNYQMNVRVITATAWQSLFARNCSWPRWAPANPCTSARISPLSPPRASMRCPSWTAPIPKPSSWSISAKSWSSSVAPPMPGRSKNRSSPS